MNQNLYRLLAEYPLEILLQTIPTGLFLVDTDKTILYWNAEAERISGFSSDEAVGQHCSFLEGMPCGNRCGLFDEEQDKPIIGASCKITTKNGQVVELSKNVDLLYDRDGQVIGGIEAFVDITRQKELEDALRAEVEERTRELSIEKDNLRAVLDGMLDPAFICGRDYQLTFINQAMRTIVGEVHQQPCYQAIFQLDRPCENCPMDEVLEGKVVSEERCLSSNERIYEVVHSPYPQKERPTHKLAVCRDMTERIEIRRRLQQANRELDAFVSTVSHDLRSPLTPLIVFAEFLEERYADQLDDIGLESVREIQKTADRMKDLLEDLLSLSRVGKLPQPASPIDTTQLVHEVLAELADKIDHYQAQVKVSWLPMLTIPETLLADLFRNLLVNALHYAANHDPRIEVYGECLSDRIRLSVVDHGPGVPEHERDSVFEAFCRGQGTTQIAGTGIGLSTVARIAQAYGGKAYIMDTPGGGTTVVVDLEV